MDLVIRILAACVVLPLTWFVSFVSIVLGLCMSDKHPDINLIVFIIGWVFCISLSLLLLIPTWQSLVWCYEEIRDSKIIRNMGNNK